MKNSIEVENYWIQKHPNGIYHLLFNTKSKWVRFHSYSETGYLIGGTEDDDIGSQFYQELPEGLLPETGGYQCLTQQCKDQISFYYIPTSLLFRNGEVMIYNSKDHQGE